MSIESVMPSNHLILCHPLIPPSIFPSIRVFSNESVLHIRWPKHWSFSFSISPSSKYSGLISFKDGLAGSPCSLRDSQESSPTPQFKSINSLALSFLYSPTLTWLLEKTIAFTRLTFVGKVILCFLICCLGWSIALLPRSKRLLISWLQSPSAVIFQPKKIKSVFVSPFICHEVIEPDTKIFIFWKLSFRPVFSLYSFIKKLFSSSLHSAIRVVSSEYLRILTFLLAIFIPSCVSSSPAFRMMYSAYKLNKQGDNIQPWRTPS